MGIDIHLCERVNTEAPEIPPRSWAHHLSPIGVREPDTESLTSYFARLSEAHGVTPSSLFKRRKSVWSVQFTKDNLNGLEILVEPNAQNATSQINGTGLAAEKWVEMLKGLTLKQNLQFLTFLSWGPVLHRSTCRPERAWCPACLEEWRTSNLPIYEKLCWTHKLVKVCANHKRYLEVECSQCKSSSFVLCGWSRPGICPRCRGWLGGHLSEESNVEGSSLNEASYEVFAANQIGGLIAIAPTLNVTPNLKVSKTSIIICAERFFAGNLCAFTRYFGLGKTQTTSLGKGRIERVTDLELLLRVAFKSGVPLLDLLTKEDALACFSPLSSPTETPNRLSPRLRKETVLRALTEALNEIPSPSVNEIAKRLGYRSTDALRRYFPVLFNQLTANYLKSEKGKEKAKPNFAMLQNDEVIKAALISALSKEKPPSLGHVARQLGYKTAQGIRSRFPELSMALTSKRLNQLKSRIDKSEGELKKALSSNPPISLETVSGNLGYKTTSMLRTKYPELCREVRSRYTEYTRAQFISSTENNIGLILTESPPIPLKHALQRLGVSDRFLLNVSSR